MTDVELTVSVPGREPGSIRLVATLVVTAMLSGIVLAGAFQVTKPVIEANRMRELRAGVFTVVPGATRVRTFTWRDGRLVDAEDDDGASGPVLYAGYDDDSSFRGWAMVGEGAGFQDTIRVLHGFDPTQWRVTGMHILLSRETPGLGDKIFKDADWVASFDALAVEPPITVVRDGRDEAHEVDAITGATISSQAVVKIINEANAAWLPRLPPPGAEPALERDASGDTP
ncbi:MAG: FMN-binding protein [Phycisphaerae bacterium]|nr:FMN-binding protein [Phycisphaerae bacterium]NNF43867.1 FMN-binding protein [Phycisphaerales bacterium]